MEPAGKGAERVTRLRYDKQRMERVAEIADEAVGRGKLPSIAISWGDRERMVWSHVAPGDDGVALDSLFPIASITKPIVATAVMQLVEQGRLLLSDPVASFVPEFAQQGKQHVTVWHLLTHTSGLSESSQDLLALVAQRAPASAYLHAACAVGLRFEPGSQYEYGNLSFVLLAELITRLSGQPYPEYIRERILAPLGMDETTFRPVDPGRVAPSHNFGDAAMLEYYHTLSSPHGGLWSSVADLQKLGRAFLNGGQIPGYRLLSPAALEAMTRLHTGGLMRVVDGRRKQAVSGLGWAKAMPTSTILASERSFGHGGGTGCFLWIDPAWELVFVFLSSRWGSDHDVPQRAINAVYGALERLG